MGGKAAKLVDNPLVVPTDESLATPLDLRAAGPEGRRGVRRALRGDHRLRLMPMGPSNGTIRAGSGPAGRRGCCSGPGLLFLFLFFFFPLYTLFRMSLSAVADALLGSGVRLALGQLLERVLAVQRPVLPVVPVRRSRHAARAVIAYPLAYVIAFRGGRFKNILLGLVVVPFFTNFLIRTLAWKTILGDQGAVVGLLRDIGILGPNGTLLRTPSPSSAGSPTTSCRSWCCRSTSRWRRSTRA